MPTDDSDSLYDLADEPAVAPPLPKPPRPAALLIYRSTTVDKRAAAADVDTIKDLYLPMWLVIGGVLVEIAAVVLSHQRLSASLIDVALRLILGTALVMAGVQLAAWRRQTALGSLRTRLLKVAAVYVAPTATFMLLSPLAAVFPFGGLLLAGAMFVFYFALLGALFDLDESDTWYFMAILFLVSLAVYFATMAVL